MRLFAVAALLLLSAVSVSAAGVQVFDFGPTEALIEPGAEAVNPATAYTAERGFGWVGRHSLQARDRGPKDKLRRDFVYGHDAADFRIDVPNGYYRVTLITGDTDAGNHVMTVTAEGKEILTDLQPVAGEVRDCAFTVKVEDGSIDLRFISSTQNWILNGLMVAPADGPGELKMTSSSIARPRPPFVGPVAHNDRLHLIKKPDYSSPAYPSASDYMRILERFPMYGERGWHANYLDNPDIGYFGDPTHGEMGLRAMGNYIFVMALLATDPAYDPKPSGVSRETVLARARACLAYMTRSHATGDLVCADGFQWGNHWQSAWWTAKMAAGARLLWPHLTPEERESVERVVVHEADRHLHRVPPSGMTSDTKSEENGWDTEVIAWAIGLFPKHPNSAAWRTKLSEFCMNTLSAPQDKNDTTVVDGKPVKDWVVSTNIHEDFTIENHGAYHFCYMACPLHSLAWGFEGLVGGGQEPPDALFHHYRDVWRWVKRTYVGEGRFAYLSGKDWPRYAYGLSFILPAIVLAQIEYDDADARRVEIDRIAKLEHEQLINADGSFYGGRFTRNVLEDRLAEYETDTYANLGLCYLLHKHHKAPVAPSPNALRKHLAGSWSSPGSAWAFGRSDKLFASFSWRYLHGIRPVGLFIPAGCADMAEWMPNQLIGQFDIAGVDARKAKLQHAAGTFKGGFSTTGEITHCDSSGNPLVRQQISYTALTNEGIAVVIERAVAAAPIKVRASRGLNMALGNDIFNGSVRRVFCKGSGFDLPGAKNLGTVEAADPVANSAQATPRPVQSPWLNIDDRLGIALLRGDSFTVHDTSGRNSPWGSIQYDVISALNEGERALDAGGMVMDSALMFTAGDSKTTAVTSASAAVVNIAGNPGVRCVLLKAPSGKRYLVAANLDGVARTVTVRPTDTKAHDLKFKGYETRVVPLD